jgi:hypothetical protein
MVRLLLCLSCDSIDTLPPHDGRPEDDVLLERLIHDHHTHPLLGEHKGLMFSVPLKHWAKDSTQRAIIKQMREGMSSGLDELDEDFYATRDTYREDAAKCYNAHLRPKGGCPDYMSDAKKILPPTNPARKDLGLAPVQEVGIGIHLCQMCPVHVGFVTQQRAKKGMYK